MNESLRVELPAELLDAIAERAVDVALARLAERDGEGTPPASPYITVPEAADYFRCNRQRIDDLSGA